MARARFNNAYITKIVTRSAREGIDEIMEEVLEEAVKECPKRDGKLYRTGKINKFAKSSTITFGDDEVNYAEIQHEDLSFRHRPGEKAKYLEDPFNRVMPGARARIKKKIAEDLAREK